MDKGHIYKIDACCGHIYSKQGVCVVRLAVLTVFLFSLPVIVPAQIVTPLHISSASSIKDEFGINLRGTFCKPGCLVQVLGITDGTNHPPMIDGRPDSRNPILDNGETGIGALTSPVSKNAGKFGHAVADSRPPDGSSVFVRVFNAPSLAEASFYADSQIFTVDGNKVFEVKIAKTDKALSPTDSDGDGLSDSWERSYDSDPGNVDTDGDGMKDGDEIRAGTDVKDSGSLLMIARIVSLQGTDLTIAWDSVAGKRYRVECTDSPALNDAHYTNISAVITATGPETQTTLSNAAAAAFGFIRVYLVE